MTVKRITLALMVAVAQPLAARRFRWDVSLPALNPHENGSILFPSAPWKLWLCLRLFGLFKLLLYRFCISLSDALDELAERKCSPRA